MKKVLGALIIIAGLILIGIGLFPVAKSIYRSSKNNNLSGAINNKKTQEKKNEKQSNERDASLKQIKIVNSFINIRSNKSVNSNKLGKVYKDEIYTIISEDLTSDYKWIEIETSSGIKGYISGLPNYVEKLYDETTNEKEVVKDTKEEVRNTEEIKTNKSTTTTKKSNSTTTTNKESNTNNVVENKKEESTPKEEVKQKQALEPTKGKGCPPGYTANRTNCEKRIIDRSLITRVCPKGYTKEGYQCVQGEDRSSIKASQDIMCPNANEMPSCVDSNYQNCRCNSGKAYVGYKCPNGYHHEYVSVHGLTGHYCVWNNPKKTTSMIDGCSDSSYEYSVTYGCYKYDFKPFETVYKCPNGYTLESDNKCYEN